MMAGIPGTMMGGDAVMPTAIPTNINTATMADIDIVETRHALKNDNPDKRTGFINRLRYLLSNDWDFTILKV